MFDFFVFNLETGLLEINEYAVLLVSEFKALIEPKRNITKSDKTGKKLQRAYKELAYLWLNFNDKGPYKLYSVLERHENALEDSKLTMEEFDDETFRAACRKYQEIIGSNRIYKLLNSVYNSIEKATDYFENEVDFSERDNNGKPIFKLTDFQREVKGLKDMIIGVKEVEALYLSDSSTDTKFRAGAQEGYDT